MWEVTSEAGRYCAGEVVVGIQVEDDEKAW
jgi:hypothetical protein